MQDKFEKVLLHCSYQKQLKSRINKRIFNRKMYSSIDDATIGEKAIEVELMEDDNYSNKHPSIDGTSQSAIPTGHGGTSATNTIKLLGKGGAEPSMKFLTKISMGQKLRNFDSTKNSKIMATTTGKNLSMNVSQQDLTSTSKMISSQTNFEKTVLKMKQIEKHSKAKKQLHIEHLSHLQREILGMGKVLASGKE